MAFEVKEFTNLGMDRDSVISKTEHTFAFTNYNIRLSSSDNSTVLSVTNERGPKELHAVITKRIKNNKITLYKSGDTLEAKAEFPLQSDVYIIYYVNGERSYVRLSKGSTWIYWPSGYENNNEYEINSSYVSFGPNEEYDTLSDEYFLYFTNHAEEPEDNSYSNISIFGRYAGHCIAGKYLVLFTHDHYNDINYIYRLEVNSQGCEGILLYEGKLGIKYYNNVEALYYYESEDVQKVYWVDSENPPRVINIMAESNYHRLDTQFDFTPTTNTLPRVKIKKDYNGVGLFPSGTIQYFLSYYNKHGAETGIVFSSALQYLSLEDRGAKADEVVTCSFDINISNIDTSFDYVRIYSAKRTSKNGPIELNIVADVQITGSKISITDSNISQETVDPNILYYIGGTSFIAGTLAQKNDTLFMGDITLVEDNLNQEIRDEIRKIAISQIDKFYNAQYIKFVYKCFTGPTLGSDYDHSQQINYSSRMFKTFKRGEIYRFAIQFLSKTGKWTTPIWIGDKKCDVHPQYDFDNNQIVVPDVEFTLPHQIRELISDNYSKYRILMAETNYANRSIVAQGVVCPTMFNYEERFNNKPHSIASWIMRPRGGNAAWEHLSDTGVNSSSNSEIQCLDKSTPPIIDSTSANSVGDAVLICVGLSKYKKIQIAVYATSYIENYTSSNLLSLRDSAKIIKWVDENNNTWRQCYDTLFNVFTTLGLNMDAYMGKENFLGRTPTHSNASGGVDESYSGAFGVEGDVSTFHFYIKKTAVKDAAFDVYKKQSNYYVDNSIVTFNSPDLEEAQDIIDNSNLAFRIVGMIPVTASFSNASLTPSTTGISPYSRPSVKSTSFPNFKGRAETLLTGNFYQDFAWTRGEPNGMKDFIYASGDIFSYKVHMWNKEGSIIGQNQNTFIKEGDGKKPFDTVKAELKDKLFATQRYSYSTEYLEDKFVWTSGISKIVLFNSDELTIKRIDSMNGVLYYQGNYDKLVTVDGGYVTRGNDYDKSDVRYVGVRQYDPVRINYKTTPHAVFTLEDGNGKLNILPRTKNETKNRLSELYPDYKFDNNADVKYPWDELNVDSRYKCLGIHYLKKDGDVNTIISHLNAEIEKLYAEGTDIREDISNYTVFALVTSIKSRVPDKFDFVLRLKNTPSGIEYLTAKNIGGVTALVNTYGISMIGFTTSDPSENTIKLKNVFKARSRSIVWDTQTIYEEDLIDIDTPAYPYLYMAELYREIPYNNLYGGYDENSIERINWIPISDSTDIYTIAKQMEGDTYYQRWDCMKTYPFTEESTNKVVDVTSFMVETHINLDGRCDVNRGNSNLLNARPTNFGLINPSYTQDDNVFKYNILDSKFALNRFSNQVTWSLTKSPTEDIDVWTGITLNSSLYLDGSYGRVTKLLNVNDNIVAFQEKGISTIQYNERVQISTESGAPIEIQNSKKVTGYNYVTNNYGCKNKFSIVPTKTGVYFIDELNKTFSKFSKDGIVDVSSQGMASWFKNNDIQDLKSFYDSITHDIYLVDSNTCLVFNEDLNRFSSFFDYEGSTIIFNNEGSSFIYHDKFYEMFKGTYGVGINNLRMDYWIEYRVNPEPYIDKTFTNVEFIADILDPEDDINSPHTESEEDVPFNRMDVWNSYQEGYVELSRKLLSPIAKKFRIWRVQIPRDNKSKFKNDRIRSPWMHLKLSNNAVDKKMIFHNLVVKYFK